MRSAARRIIAGTTAVAALITLPAAAASASEAPTELWVSPAGKNLAAGTRSEPIKSLPEAFGRMHHGGIIRVLPGSYPRVEVRSAYPKAVSVVGVGAASVNGIALKGAQNVSVRGLRVTDGIEVQAHPTYKLRRPATDISIEGNDVSASGKSCVSVRSAARVRVTGNQLHHCHMGVSSPGYSSPSSDVTVEGNTMEDLSGDGVMLGHWRRGSISDNVIRRISHPRNKTHNDGIQIIGDATDVTVSGNRVSASADQLMIVQDSFGPVTGLTVSNNLFDGAGSYAVMLFGTVGTKFVNNTVWHSRYGGILVRDGKGGDPVNLTVANNVTSGLDLYKAKVTHRRGNLVAKIAKRTVPGPADLTGADPLFVDPEAGDFRLRSGSPAVGIADPILSPATDISGVVRSGSGAATAGAYAGTGKLSLTLSPANVPTRSGPPTTSSRR